MRSDLSDAVSKIQGKENSQSKRIGFFNKWQGEKTGRMYRLKQELATRTRQGRYCGREGGFPRVRLTHCPSGVRTPAISPHVENSAA